MSVVCRVITPYNTVMHIALDSLPLGNAYNILCKQSFSYKTYQLIVLYIMERLCVSQQIAEDATTFGVVKYESLCYKLSHLKPKT